MNLKFIYVFFVLFLFGIETVSAKIVRVYCENGYLEGPDTAYIYSRGGAMPSMYRFYSTKTPSTQSGTSAYSWNTNGCTVSEYSMNQIVVLPLGFNRFSVETRGCRINVVTVNGDGVRISGEGRDSSKEKEFQDGSSSGRGSGSGSSVDDRTSRGDGSRGGNTGRR